MPIEGVQLIDDSIQGSRLLKHLDSKECAGTQLSNVNELRAATVDRALAYLDVVLAKRHQGM